VRTGLVGFLQSKFCSARDFPSGRASFWRCHFAPVSFTSNFRSAASTLGMLNLTHRLDRRRNGIRFSRTQLSIVRGLTDAACAILFLFTRAEPFSAGSEAVFSCGCITRATNARHCDTSPEVVYSVKVPHRFAA